MTRVAGSLAVLLVVALLAGCTGTVGDVPSTGPDGTPTSDSDVDDVGDGQFTAVTVSEAPPNETVVNYSDQRVRENEYLREAVREAVNESENGVVGVPERDVEKTKRDLKALPMHTIDESEASGYDWGYYIRYEQTVVRAIFVVLE